MPITNSSGNNRDIVNKLQELLLAFNSLQFNQPPLVTTSPAPFTINFSPGEIKEIIPASTSPRRIVIKSLSGEVKLLLGTAENIELSAISVNGDRLIDERWQGAIFGYSANGAEIAVNIEIENNSNNNSGDIDDMPYFASKTDLINADATYSPGQTILLSNANATDGYFSGADVWAYFDSVSPNTGNFTTDSDRLAFVYKTGTFLNITNPGYANGFNLFKYIPAWMIDALFGKKIKLLSERITGEGIEWQEVLIQLSQSTPLFPLRNLFIEKPTIEYLLLNRKCTIISTNLFDFNTNSDFSTIAAYIANIIDGRILPGETIDFVFTQILNANVENPVRIRCIGKKYEGGYSSTFSSFLLTAGGSTGLLEFQLISSTQNTPQISEQVTQISEQVTQISEQVTQIQYDITDLRGISTNLDERIYVIENP